MDEYPKLIWEHEYNKKWIPYTYEECLALNKAVSKNQKTVTLPSKDPKKKLNINLIEMFQKNVLSGYEQRIRCLIYNDGHFCWCWEDDYGDFTSYTPRTALYLETAHVKGMAAVDIILKEEYTVSFLKFEQKNKITGFIRKISRHHVTVDLSKWKNNEKDAAQDWNTYCQQSIKKMSRADKESLKNILFSLPIMQTEMPDFELPDINPEISSLRQDNHSSTSVSSVSVDPVCPEAKNCHVYSEDGTFYSAVLNLTDVIHNNNKFYNIQLLKCNNKRKYILWFHWGRVGYQGQTNLLRYDDVKSAKEDFKKKFYDKTKNKFEDVKNFKKVPSKYDLVDIDLSHPETSSLPVVESKLDKRIQSLLELICNKETLEEAAKDLMYDSKAIPLGKITAKQIEEGYIALRNICTLLQNTRKINADLVEACNVFYTKIPHNFGKKSPPIIKSMDDVKEKLRMLEALSNICLAMNIIGSSEGVENPIDAYYKHLECSLIPIEHDSDEFQALRKCVSETHGPSHSYTLEITQAFKCIKNDQEKCFSNFGNNKLLFHGSRVSNWLSILKKGLQIAPPEAPVTGYMFGKGVYFADMCTKSANYCYPTKKNNEGILQISVVSLGNSLELQHAKDCSRLPKEYQSVFGIGKLIPSFEKTILSSEATVPCGPLEERIMEDLTLNYNEYVIYNTSQIKMKYLLRIKFIYP